MKRKIAFVLALTLTASMFATGCGKTDETKTDDNTASSVTETVSGTESGTDSTDGATEAATESGTSKTDLFTNIKFASKSSYTVPEVGKYETYLDGFKLPENVAYVTAEDDSNGGSNGMLFAKANGVMYMHLNFDAPASAMSSTKGTSETEDESNVKTDEPLQDAAAEAIDKEKKTEQADAEMKGELGTVSTGDIAPAEKTHVDAAVFIDDKYAYLSLSNGDSDKAIAQRAELGKDKDSDNELNDMVNSLEGMDKTTFAFTEYAGEETIDGTAYDVISAVMTTVDDDEHETEPTEESTNVKVYFTKDGGFYMLKFDLDESTKGTLYEIESITIPDAEWQDVETAELGESLFSAFMLMAAGSDGVNFSDTDDTDVDTTDSPAADNSDDSDASETSEAAETTEAPESEDSAAETAVSFTVLDQ